MTSSLPMTFHRSFVLLLSLGLMLGAGLPLATAPGARAASSTLVISQVYGGGGNAGATYTNDFIEIFNLGTTAVDVSTWSVQYTSATGTSWQRTNLSGTISPGGYYLVQQAAGAGGTTPLPAPDAVGTIPMSGTAGKVALLSSQTTLPACGSAAAPCLPNASIVDYVGYGDTASEFEGSGPTGALSNTTSATRGNACVDADSNGSEFTIGAPTPRNGATAAAPCGTVVPTDPTGAGSASPASVAVGATTTLRVTVTPGSNPTSSAIAVSVDLTPIGGSAAQAFFDDGLTGGDTTAADNVFTWTAVVAAATAPGSKTLVASITDAQARSASASISLLVQGPPTEIWQIQGASHVSPRDGQQVFQVEGIVTAVRNNGFWMTDPTPDTGPGSDATSNGIFVFRGSAARPAVGDHVRVDGTVVEFPANQGTNLRLTEIESFTALTPVSSGNALPTTVIGVDRVPPGLVIDNDSTTTVEAGSVFDPAEDGIDFWESLEGMRLSVADAVAVGPRNNFGEIAVVSKLTNAGLRTPRGGILVRGLGAPGDYRSGDFNPERLILDDVLAATPSVNVGDEFVTDPVGVLDYAFGNFKLLVTENPGRVDNGLLAEVTRDDSGRELSVATFNVENLSAIPTAAEAAKVARLAVQVVTNLNSPDIIAIEEIQDNSGPGPAGDNGVVAADQSWLRLIQAIVDVGGPRYEYRQIDPENNADGGAPGGNIRVGFLFLPSDDLAFVDRPGGDATTDTDVVHAPRGRGDDDDGSRTCSGKAQLTLSPGRIIDANVGGADAFFETRKSLAGEFCFRGETIFIVVNHLSSKGDDRPLFGHFQPPFRLTEFRSLSPAPESTEDGWRHAQAQAINDFVDEILEVDPNAHVIVLGDINDFDFSETVDILSGERIALDPGPFAPDADGSGPTAATGAKAILTSLFAGLLPEERYSYVFDGNSQVLDQILVSNSLLRKRPTYDVVHVNAEFANQASDHDPSIMVVRLEGNNGH